MPYCIVHESTSRRNRVDESMTKNERATFEKMTWKNLPQSMSRKIVSTSRRLWKLESSRWLEIESMACRLVDLTEFIQTVYMNCVKGITRRLEYENYVSKSSRRVNKIEWTSRWLVDSSTWRLDRFQSNCLHKWCHKPYSSTKVWKLRLKIESRSRRLWKFDSSRWLEIESTSQ